MPTRSISMARRGCAKLKANIASRRLLTEGESQVMVEIVLNDKSHVSLGQHVYLVCRKALDT
jgi:hypothetical protein